MRSGSVVPESGPAVTTSRVGPFFAGFAGFGVRPRRPPPLGAGRRRGGALVDAGAVEVAAQHADDGEDERPQPDEQAEPEHGEGELAQHGGVTAARRGR